MRFGLLNLFFSRSCFNLLLLLLLSITSAKQSRSKFDEYRQIQNSLQTGWNTWNTSSVLQHVLLPQGFAINLAFKQHYFLEEQYLDAALIGRREKNAEIIRPGPHTYGGRLFLSFRDTAPNSPTQGDWVAWIGTYDDIAGGNPGELRIRIKDNKHKWDCAYPGVEILPNGEIVATTYGHWDEGASPYILSVRINVEDLK